MYQYNKSMLLSKTNSISNILLAMLFAIFTAVCAKVYVPLWFTPVPITLQVFAVILTGLVLGSRLGAISQTIYISLGLAGAPVFTGFSAGIPYLAGPTGGYIVGFILAAFAAGWVSERLKSKSWLCYFISGIIGIAVIYLFGMCWFASWVSAAEGKSWIESIKNALAMAVLPFIGIDLAKAISAAMIVSGVKFSNSIIGKLKGI